MSKIVINGKVADLEEGGLNRVSLSSEIESNANPVSDRPAARMLKVTLPPTNRNHGIMGHGHDASVNDVAISDLFDVIVEADGVPVLVGKGKRVSSAHGKNPKGYAVSAWGTNADWVSKLAILRLNDAAPDSFIWDVSHIDAVMNDTATDNPDTAGREWIFAPVIYLQNTGYTWEYKDMYPQLTAYGIIVRAFASIGYRIVSEFINSDFFKRLVLPYGWGRFGYSDEWFRNNIEMRASVDGVGHIEIPDTFPLDTMNHETVAIDNDTDLPNFDYGNNYDTTIFRYTAPRDGVYHFFVSNFEVKYTDAEGDVMLMFVVDSTVEQGLQALLDILVSNDIIGGELTVFHPVGTWFEVDSGYAETPRIMELSAGQTVEVVAGYYKGSNTNPGVNSASFRSFDIRNLVFTVEAVKDFVLGDTVDWSDLLPEKELFINFWKGLKHDFNLYVIADTLRQTVYIEPQLSWKENTGETGKGFIDETLPADNISGRIDLSKDSEVSDFDKLAQRLIFSHNQDGSDGYLNRFEKEYQIGVGQSTYNFPERFKANEDRRRNPYFAGVVHTRSSQNTLFALMVSDVSAEIGDTHNSANRQFKPKLLYYAGERTGDWFFNGHMRTTYPQVFACNYNDDAGTDPNLYFAPQAVGLNTATVVDGLMRKYYHRSLYMRKLPYYSKLYVRYNSTQFKNLNHRRPHAVNGLLMMLAGIEGYKPSTGAPSNLTLWRLGHPDRDDLDNIENDPRPGLIRILPPACMGQLLFSCTEEDGKICITATFEGTDTSATIRKWDSSANGGDGGFVVGNKVCLNPTCNLSVTDTELNHPMTTVSASESGGVYTVYVNCALSASEINAIQSGYDACPFMFALRVEGNGYSLPIYLSKLQTTSFTITSGGINATIDTNATHNEPCADTKNTWAGYAFDVLDTIINNGPLTLEFVTFMFCIDVVPENTVATFRLDACSITREYVVTLNDPEQGCAGGFTVSSQIIEEDGQP